jgi:hypothetical protein
LIILIILGKVNKLMLSSPTSCHFIFVWSKYSPQQPVKKHLHCIFLP